LNREGPNQGLSGSQPRLVGFAGHPAISNQDALRLAIREELTGIKEMFGQRTTAISGIGSGANLVFLRACVELRIPVILISPHICERRLAEDFHDNDEWIMARHLISVALAKYVAPEQENGEDANQLVARHLLEFADVFLFTWHGEAVNERDRTGEIIGETRELGIPARIIHSEELSAHWSFAPDLERGARHGFGTRKELLEFFDARLPTLFC